MKYLIPLLLSIIIAACGGNKGSMDSLSDYTIKQDALPNHSKVKVLQYSGGPSIDDNAGCYHQYLIQEVETGNTYRLFAPFTFKYTDANNKSEVLQYISITSTETGDKTILKDLNELQNLETFDKVVHVDVDEGIAKLPIVIGVLSKNYTE